VKSINKIYIIIIMDGLDLDISNYNIHDLERFFQLKPKSKYTAADIEEKEYQIREQLLNSGHINKRFKRDLLAFLETAKDWLIYVKCKPFDRQPTTIPKNHQLDTLNTPLSKVPPSRTEELITRPETQYVNSLPGEFFPGVINPLNSRVITKCVNIDTRFRDNYNNTVSSDFVLQLPEKFSKVVSMQLASFELPISFYGISSGYNNNFLYLEVKYLGFTSRQSTTTIYDASKTIIVPDGNYAAIDLISKINFLLSPRNTDNTLIYPDDIFSYISLTLDITINGSGSGKVTIAPNPDTKPVSYSDNIKVINMDFTKNANGIVDYVNISSKLGWNLGFQKRQYLGGTTYTGETIIEPSNIRYIYLMIDDFNNNVNSHFVNPFNKSLMTSNILARIAMKSASFSILMENDFNMISEPRKYFGPVDIQKMKIQLVDEYGKILQMNNSDFSFCINLKMLYDL